VKNARQICLKVSIEKKHDKPEPYECLWNQLSAMKLDYRKELELLQDKLQNQQNSYNNQITVQMKNQQSEYDAKLKIQQVNFDLIVKVVEKVKNKQRDFDTKLKTQQQSEPRGKIYRTEKE